MVDWIAQVAHNHYVLANPVSTSIREPPVQKIVRVIGINNPFKVTTLPGQYLFYFVLGLKLNVANIQSGLLVDGRFKREFGIRFINRHQMINREPSSTVRT